MKNLELIPVLYLILSLPLIFEYRVLPVVGTPYWYFTLFFIIHLINLAGGFPGLRTNIYSGKRQTVIAVSVIAISLYGVMATAIIDRGKTAPGQVYGVHDIVLQLESALQFVSRGINPYQATYENTPMKDWIYEESGKRAVNPALYHFVMPPFYLLFSFPFYFVSMRTLGYFDGRMPLLLCTILLSWIILSWFRDRKLGLLALALVLFNPVSLHYLIEGRSDMVALFWYVSSLFALQKRKFTVSVILYALAFSTKQSVWFSLPFYAFYISKLVNSRVKIFTYALIFAGVIALLFGPFILWDPAAFISSTVLYLSGNAIHGYPISGYGLGMLLVEMGFIDNIHAYHPFILWQLLLGIPITLVCLKFINRKPTQSRLILAYGLTLFVFWWSSRYFNNSHAGYISNLAILGYLKSVDNT